MRSVYLSALSFLILFLLLGGCQKGPDAERSLDALREEVPSLSVKALKERSTETNAAVVQRYQLLEPLKSDFLRMTAMEQAGEDGVAIADTVDKLESEIKSLKAQVEIYNSELKKRGEEGIQFLY